MIETVGILSLERSEYIHELENDEAFLVAQCVEKKRLAQKVLYEQNYSRLLAVSIRYLENQAEAEDVLHDCFIKIFKVISSFKGASKLSTWLTRLVINEVLMYLRKKKRWPQQVEFDPQIELEDEVSMEELQPYRPEQVLKMIKELPSGCREVLSLYSVDGYSHAEVAAALDIAESSSRSQLARARRLLKEKLKERKEGTHG